MDIEQQADMMYYNMPQQEEQRIAPVLNDPLNAYRVPGVMYDKNVRTFVIDGRTVYCSFGRVTVCGN